MSMCWTCQAQRRCSLTDLHAPAAAVHLRTAIAMLLDEAEFTLESMEPSDEDAENYLKSLKAAVQRVYEWLDTND